MRASVFLFQGVNSQAELVPLAWRRRLGIKVCLSHKLSGLGWVKVYQASHMHTCVPIFCTCFRRNIWMMTTNKSSSNMLNNWRKRYLCLLYSGYITHVQYCHIDTGHTSCKNRYYEDLSNTMLSNWYRSYNPLFDTCFVVHLINTLPHDAQTFDELLNLQNLSARYKPNNLSARHETTIPQINYYKEYIL